MDAETRIALIAPDEIAAQLAAKMDETTRRSVCHISTLDGLTEARKKQRVDALLCYGPTLSAAGEPNKWRRAAHFLPLVLVLETRPTREETDNLLHAADDYLTLKDADPESINRAILNATNIHRLHDQFRQVLAESPDGVVIVDALGDVLYANSAAAIMLGRNTQDMVAQPFGIPVTADASTEVELPQERTAEMRVADVEWLGTPAFLASLRDITERKQTEAKLIRAAERDGLTGLANRVHFQSELSKAIANASETPRRLAVFFIDLDNFKTINDQMGHDAGDQLLRTVADRLRGASRSETLLGRLGGDEFIVLARDVDAGGEVVIAERFLDTLNRTVNINSEDVSISASIGIATYPTCGNNAHALIMAADAAMYAAKQAGRNRFEYFSKAAGSASARRKQLDVEMRLAMTRKQFELVYQPLFRIDDAQPVAYGCEALLRWNHGELGSVPPGEFIPVAESNGWISAIGRWVVVEACRQLSQWQEDPDSAPDHVSINVSTQQMRDIRFAEFMARVTQETGVEPSGIWLEITETALMHNLDECIDALTKLRALGIKIAIDDFGTGYSSLAYLQRLPIDVIKIDRAFISGIGTQVGDTTIVNSVMQIAQSQNLLVVAEGVETEQELACIKRLNCDMAQGYLLARPVPASELASACALKGK